MTQRSAWSSRSRRSIHAPAGSEALPAGPVPDRRIEPPPDDRGPRLEAAGHLAKRRTGEDLEHDVRRDRVAGAGEDEPRPEGPEGERLAGLDRHPGEANRHAHRLEGLRHDVPRP